MNYDDPQVLPDDQDEITTFVTVNRAVFDAVEAMLQTAADLADSKEDVAFKEFKTPYVTLEGGREQVNVLVSLASENGLEMHAATENELVLSAPGYPLNLVVRCDLDAKELESDQVPNPQPGLSL